MNATIQIFHADDYDHTINKMDFYLPHVTSIGRNHYGKTKYKVFGISHRFMDFNIFRYYADNLYFQFCN